MSTMIPVLSVYDENGNEISIPAIVGKSAYAYAVAGGYTGTEAEFAAKLAQEVDTTLTIVGAPADAKAVGDKISEISEEIENLQKSGLTTAQVNALDGMFKITSFTEDPTTAYNAFKVAFGIEVGGEVEPDTEKTLTSISATYSGGDVVSGTAVTELTGIVVTATYSDGSTADVTGYTLSGDIIEGENTITVSYNDMTTTFTVTGVTGGEAELITDGLVAYFDLRNVDMDAANTANSVGTGYGIPTATEGSGSLYAWGAWATETDEYGVVTSRAANLGEENLSTAKTLGTEFTFVGFSYGSGYACAEKYCVAGNGVQIKPRYVNASGSEVILDAYEMSGTFTRPEGYKLMVIRCSGKKLDFSYNAGEYVASYDGSDYENFGEWSQANTVRIFPYNNNGKLTALAWYDRALTDVEIVEMYEFLKTLEVTA